jgi:hypothetical protein
MGGEGGGRRRRRRRREHEEEWRRRRMAPLGATPQRLLQHSLLRRTHSRVQGRSRLTPRAGFIFMRSARRRDRQNGHRRCLMVVGEAALTRIRAVTAIPCHFIPAPPGDLGAPPQRLFQHRRHLIRARHPASYASSPPPRPPAPPGPGPPCSRPRARRSGGRSRDDMCEHLSIHA